MRLRHWERSSVKETIWFFIKRLIHNYNKHNVSRLAAESTYYLILSIVPFFIFALNCLLIFAQSQLDTVFMLLGYLPPDTSEAIEPVVLNLLEERSGTGLSIGLLLAFWSTSKGINALVRALNVILSTSGREESFIRVTIKSLVFTLLGATAGILSLLFLVYGKALLNFVDSLGIIMPQVIELWSRLILWGPLVVGIISLSIFYRFAPYYEGVNRFNWLKTFLSGFVGTSLWIIVTVGYRAYVTNFANLSMTYGSLVGLMILFVWLNLSAQAVLLGAEFTVTMEETILISATKRMKEILEKEKMETEKI